LLQQLPEFLESVKSILRKINRPVILTGEYTPMNFLVKQVNGIWHIDGLIDFGEAMLGAPEYDLLGPGAFLIQGDKKLLKSFLMACGYTNEKLTQNLSRKLTALMLLHQYSNLNIQVRIEGWKNKVKTIADLEDLVWGF
jgi:hygromycin-B 7''-O-kinase